jgi:hypothetical protein
MREVTYSLMHEMSEGTDKYMFGSTPPFRSIIKEVI